MATGKDVLAIAVNEIGVTESPANSNKVKYNTWFYGREVSGSAYPWCMTFVQWCYNKAGAKLPYITASCSALLNWYTKNHPDRVIAKASKVAETLQPGDIVIYSFGHTGILEAAHTDGTLTVIEGNTSPGAAGSQSNGGGVFRRTRSMTLVTACIRPVSASTSAAIPEPAQESKTENTPENTPENTNTKESDTMTGQEILSALTDAQAYQLLQKAQRHAATLPEPTWSQAEGHWQRAKSDGTINGNNPEGFIKRDEVIAVLGRKGI